MVNLEKVQLSKQNETLTEQLCLLDNSEDDEHLSSTQTDCKHDIQAFNCHILKNTSLKIQDKAKAQRKLLITCVVCLIFMIGEIIGGYAAHSLAIMTDAAHLLTDFASVLISLFSLCISSRPPSKKLTFGWHRSEVLGALLSVLSIWTVTAVLVFIAVQRIISDDYEIHSDVMIITAACAVVLNICLAVILHQSPVDRVGHSHSQTEEHRNTSIRAAFIHVLGDLLQSFGVLLAAIIIYFRPEWKIADPICTFLFSILVLTTTFTILKDILKILMEGVPHGVDFDSVNDVLLSVGGVRSTHSLHIWALTANQSQLSVHAVIDAQSDPQAVLVDMTKLLQTEYAFTNITIQIEAYPED
ncbi:proton-coupled zinc antiporter SLC30A2-like [Danio aesculapii]|uniref:proton-coupled zinc antiporter SLC30A2-like n=1 Tax=Danio aesculapii TaxID=1142201 RepID=UPI0024C038D5|nr:proton-coupled zinc antiporter SLC30A2-like [Danio aesculapii]